MQPAVITVIGHKRIRKFPGVKGNLPTTNASYNLIPGNNTVMIPLNRSDLTMASEVGLDMVMGMVDQVSYFDALTQSFSTSVDLGGFWLDDFPVSIAYPLMINSYSTFTWPTIETKIVQPPRRSK